MYGVSLTRRLIPGLFLGVTVLLGIALMGDLRQVGQLLVQFDWRIYPLVLTLTLFNYGLRFLKWHFYLHQVGVHNLGWGQRLRVFVAGFPLAMTPLKAGEALKGVWINRLSGLPVARGISVVVAERISDGLAVLGLSVIGVIAFPRLWPFFAVILLALLAVVVLSQARPLAVCILGWGEKLPVAGSAVARVRQFYEGSYALFQPGAMLVGIFLGIVSWFGEGVGFYLILVGLGLAPGTNLLSVAIFVLSFSTVIGAASALPGGLGVAEVSIAGLLTVLLGTIPPAAAAATMLIRLATLWFGVGLGLVAWSISPDLLGIRIKNEHVVES